MRGALAALWLAYVRTARLAWIGVALAAVLPWFDSAGDFATAAAAAGESAAATVGGARFAADFAPSAFLSSLALVAYARHVVRLRSIEADGLLAAPVGRAAWTIGSWLGAVMAIATAFAAIAVVLVASGRGVHARQSLLHNVATPPLSLIGEREAREFVLPASALVDAQTLRARTVSLPDRGTVVFVSLAVQRLAEDGATPASDWSRSEARVWARRTLEVAVPTGTGPLAVKLARVGEGAGVGIERDGLAALGPVSLPWLAELRAVWAALLAAAASAACVAALVPHFDAKIALSCSGLPWLLAFATGIAPDWLPGGELVAALDLAATGLAGPLPRVGVASIVVVVALALACLAPRLARESEAS